MLACAGKLRSLASGAPHGRAHTLQRTPLKPRGAIRKYPRIALFGDNHFQDRGLPRIVKTGEWITDEMKKRRVDAVVCLGDVLNTREQVSVRALSAALSFFDGLANALPGTPIHILLGNHDINLKHSRKFSSLDALGMNALSQSGLILHRELTTMASFLPGVPAIMVPYHEDPAEIIAYLDKYASSEGSASETLVFGHLAVSGAKQNHSPYRYSGTLKTSHFAPFKRTFSGHFHHHHELGRQKIVYVGSPMQFNFGDTGDTRGIIIYDTDLNSYEFVPNPHGEAFLKENDDRLVSQIADLLNQTEMAHLRKGTTSSTSNLDHAVPDNPFKDKFVQIQIESSDLSTSRFESLRDSLLSLGASGVSKTSGSLKTLLKEHEAQPAETDRGIIKHFGSITTEDIERIIVTFANSVRKAHQESVSASKSASDSNSSSQPSEPTESTEEPPKSRSSRSKSKKSSKADQSDAIPKHERSGPTRRRHTIIQQQSFHFLEDDALFARLVALGVSLASKSSTSSATLPTSHTTFPARLHSLYMKNFMGIQGELIIPFYSMNSGIWLIEGSNGAGKSTIFEALVWAQFGEFLRSGMQKDYAINDSASSCVVRLIYENGLVIERRRRRARNDSLRTYQLKKPSNDGKEELTDEEAEKEANRREEFEEATLLMNREPTDLVDAAETLDQKEASTSSRTSSRKKGASETSKRGGKRSKKVVEPEMEYEAESELGDVRNSQKQLSDRLGVNFETFTKSVVLGQNILNNFVSGNKDMRRSIIEEMLGLEKFSEWFEAAKMERVRLDEKLRLLQQRRNLLQEELETLGTSTGSRTTQLEEKERIVEGLRATRTNVENICNARIADLERNLELSQAALQSFEMQELVTELKLREERILSDEIVPSFSDELLRISAFEASLSDDLRHLKAAFAPESSEDGSGAQCATCGQEVTSDHIQRILKSSFDARRSGKAIIPSQYWPDANDAESKLSLPDSSLDTPELAYDCLIEISRISRQFKKAIAAKLQLVDDLHKNEVLVARLETSLAQGRTLVAEELAEVEKTLAASEAELEQLKAMRDEQSETTHSILSDIEAVQRDLEAANVELSMTKFWEMAFDKQSKGTVGTVRAFVFEDVVKELNAICSGYMEQLQTKQQYHLKVSLTADLEMEQVYGKRSGGERKRTDLAILFAMFELVRSQSRFVPDFLMLDEVFDTLDQDGRELVGQVLASLSKRLEKILVITHTDVASGLSIAGVLDVSMPSDSLGTPTGTEIEVSHR